MWVVQQPAANQPGNELRVLDLLAQLFQCRVNIQHPYRIATVNRGGHGGQYQLQPEWIAIAGNFALTQLQLVQLRLDHLLGYPFVCNLFQGIQYEAFKSGRLFRLAAFKATHKAHLAIGVLKAAQR